MKGSPAGGYFLPQKASRFHLCFVMQIGMRLFRSLCPVWLLAAGTPGSDIGLEANERDLHLPLEVCFLSMPGLSE